MNHCPKCGADFQEKEVRCPNCGEILSNPALRNANNGVPSDIELPISNEEKVKLSPISSTKSLVELSMKEENVGSSSSKRQENFGSMQKVREVGNILENKDVLQVNRKEEDSNKKSKKGKNKIFYLLILVLVFVFFVGMKFFLDFKGKEKNPSQNGNLVKEVEQLDYVNTNGFKFKKESNWILSEDGQDILVYDEDESLVIYLKKESSNIGALSEAGIRDVFASKSYIENLSVQELTLGVRKVYLAQLDYKEEENTSKVEYYYMDGGSNLVIGVYVLYKDNTVYEENKDIIRKMLEDLSYSDETIKTFNMKSKYSGIFSTGRSIFY